MVFGIGQIQQGMNDSDDRYQTKRLNNLKLYNLWKESFPTAPISAHQDYLNTLSGNDRWLKKQLPSNEALMAFDAERTRKRKLAEADRQYTEMTRKLEIENQLSTIVDDYASTGSNAEDINKAMTARFGPDTPLGQMYQQRYVASPNVLQNKIAQGRLTRANSIINQLSPLKLNEKETQLQLQNLGIRPENPIYKQVIQTMGVNEQNRIKLKTEKALMQIVKSPNVARAAMEGNQAAVKKALKQEATLYNVTIPDAQLEQQSRNAIANFDPDKFVGAKVKEMQAQILLAAKDISNGTNLEDVQARLSGQIGSDFPEVLREKVISRAMEMAQSASSITQQATFLQKEAGVKAEATGAIDAQLKVETTKDKMTEAGNALAGMVEKEADDLDEDEIAETKNNMANIGRSLLLGGANINGVKVAVQSLRDAGVAFADINESVIKGRMVELGIPTDRLSRIAKETQRRSKILIDPEPVQDIVRGSNTYTEQVSGMVDNVRVKAADANLSPIVFDQIKKHAIHEASIRLAEIENYVNNPQYVQGRTEQEMDALEVKRKQLSDFVIEINGMSSKQRDNLAIRKNMLMVRASGGDASVEPELYRQELKRRTNAIKKDFMNNMRKAKTANLQNVPGFEALRGILDDNSSSSVLGIFNPGNQFGRYQSALRGIIANNDRLIKDSEDAEKEAKSLKSISSVNALN